MFHQHIQQWLILCLRSHDDDIVIVLGSSTNQRDSTYIDFFNDVCFGCAGSYGSFKRIQVDNNQIYFGDFILFNLLNILFQVTTAKDTSENLRM